MLQVINTMDKETATEITNDIMTKAARDHAMYKSGDLTDAEITTRLDDVLPDIECASVVMFRGEEYIFVEHTNYPFGAAAAALMTLEQTEQKLIIINKSIIGSLEQLIAAGSMSLDIVLHEMRHHIRGPLIPTQSDITSLYDLASLYLQEEIDTNNTVNADIYTDYLHENFVGNREATMKLVGVGAMAYMSISKDMFNHIYNIIMEDELNFKALLGPASDDMLAEIHKNYKFWNK